MRYTSINGSAPKISQTIKDCIKMVEQRHTLNLEDIAKLSGVSRSTVSRVVNNHPNVSARTRQKVLAIIEEHNFQPNAMARALASQRTRVIGVLIPYFVSKVFSDPYFPTLLQSATETANQLDYSVTLWLATTNNELEILNRVINNDLLDGLIITSAVAGEAFMDILLDCAKPFILVGHPGANRDEVSYVDVENEQGSFMAVQHLIKQGRQRIAFIPGQKFLPSNQDRENGYFRALNEASLPINSALIGQPGHFTREGGYESMKSLLRQDLDAVMTASDMMALGAMEAIAEAGLKIPDDIAIASFDDIVEAANVDPPLTTVHQDTDQLGRSAAEGIIGLLEGKMTEPYRVVHPVELVVRAST